MVYNYQLSEEAEDDVYESYSWYEDQQVGLGEEFMDALDAAKTAITNSPEAYPVRYKKKIRAFVMDRFPYIVLYVVNQADIDVIAEFNTNRQHDKWKKRRP